MLRATASWDSTVHNTNSLNKITNNNDRVYGIIQVGVTLFHPPGLELILRKRICLRVYKKIGFGATLMRAFAGRVSVSQGVQCLHVCQCLCPAPHRRTGVIVESYLRW